MLHQVVKRSSFHQTTAPGCTGCQNPRQLGGGNKPCKAAHHELRSGEENQPPRTEGSPKETQHCGTPSAETAAVLGSLAQLVLGGRAGTLLFKHQHQLPLRPEQARSPTGVTQLQHRPQPAFLDTRTPLGPADACCSSPYHCSTCCLFLLGPPQLLLPPHPVPSMCYLFSWILPPMGAGWQWVPPCFTGPLGP